MRKPLLTEEEKKQRHIESNKRWITANPDKYLRTRRATGRRFYHKNKEKIRAIQKIYNMRRKENVCKAYGGKCACCGEDRIEFLTIDHINNNGNIHRQTKGLSPGTQSYLWLMREGFPEGFQVLCYNCNNAKHIYGTCPHQKGEDNEKETH